MIIKNKVTSFTKVVLRIIAMRYIHEYEIICNGTQSIVSLYNVYFCEHEDERELLEQKTIDSNEVLSILNKCNIISWNGFYGKNPKNILDGYMFNFTACVNEDLKISAHGSNNYPRHYHDFKDEINNILNNKKA